MERHEAGTSTSSSASGATAASGFNSSQARQQQTSSTRDAGTASTPTEEHQWWSGVDGRIPGVSPPLGAPVMNGTSGQNHHHRRGKSGGSPTSHKHRCLPTTTAAGDGKGKVEAASETPRFWRSSGYKPDEFAAARRASERVILNLSGTTFMTTRDTLARDPLTYFAAMLRMPPSTTANTCVGNAGSSDANGSSNSVDRRVGDVSARAGDEERSSCAPSSGNCGAGVEFFIDRDPTHFRFILNYLRDSYIGLDSFGEEDLHFLEELSHEAQFFNIAGLCSDISRRVSEIARKHRESPSGDKDFRLVQCSTGQIQDVFHEWVIERNYEFECMQIVQDTAYIVLGRRVSRGELALVERLMKT